MLDAVRSLTMNLIDGQLTETAWQSAEAIEDLRHRRIRSRERWQRRARARLINPGGEDINSDWDGIWEAATARLTTGWSAEIRIPILTLAFKPGLHEWQFNIQRRIQRRLGTDRWASPNRQYEITQTSQAGLLTSLPDFDLGKGLTIRPAITSGGGVPAPDARVEGDFQPSLDVNQRIGANVLAVALPPPGQIGRERRLEFEEHLLDRTPSEARAEIRTGIPQLDVPSRNEPDGGIEVLSDSLVSVLGTGQLALPERRSIRVQRCSSGRATRRPIRDRHRRGHCARLVRVDALPPRSGHREEAAL